MRTIHGPDSKIAKLKKKHGKRFNAGTYGYGANRKPYRDYKSKEPVDVFTGKVRLVSKKDLQLKTHEDNSLVTIP